MIYKRILLSPLILLYGVILTAAGAIFPITMIVLYSFKTIISFPFIWLFNKVGSNLNYDKDSLITHFNEEKMIGIFLNHFAGLTIYFWLPFYIVFVFIKTGKIETFDK